MKKWYRQVLDSDDPQVRQALAQALQSQRPPEPPDQVGRLVEFVRGRQCRLGVVSHQKGRRGTLGVIDIKGKERLVEVGRILDFSQRRLPLDDGTQRHRALRRIDRDRTRQLGGIDLQSLWEVVVGDAQTWWDAETLIDLYFAQRPADEERAVLVRALAGGAYFEMRQGQFRPHTRAVVEGKRAVSQARSQAAEELAQQAAWLRRVADGQPGSGGPPTAGQAIALLEEAALVEGDEPLSAAAGQLLRRAHLHGPLAAFDVLVRLGHWHADENLDLRRAGLTADFTPELVQRAQEARWPQAVARSWRWWGRRVLGWSADGEACQTAFSIRRSLLGYRLAIHCAVPGLLAGDGAMTAEAQTRGIALDLPDGRLDLLPSELTEQALLRADQRRPALALVVQLDKALAVRSYAFRLCRVRLKRVLPLSVDGGSESALLQRLAEQIRCQRQQRGALLLPAEKEVRLQRGQVEVVDGEAGAGWFLAELHHLAASLAGTWCQQRGLAALYQTQALPVAPVTTGQWNPVRLHEQIKGLPRSVWQVEPGPNARLGLDYCTPWSRPLDSYMDLLMQQQIVAALGSVGTVRSVADLQRALEETTWSREQAWHIGRRARRYWLLKGLERQVGKEVAGVVVERLGAGCLVALEDYPLKVFAPPRRERWANVGDRVRLRLVQAVARRDIVRVEGPLDRSPH
ncbi:MAG: RNB domain-containing ribonuclease [Candidatus Latescibacteria bacterium]|nr:RNB domain-containing ribonuclease [Candidatus Latescibacterota bacterium]